MIICLHDHGRRLRMTAVEGSLDPASYTHSSLDLIKLLLVFKDVTSNHRLSVIISRVLSYVLPFYTLDVVRDQMERFKVASPATISRMQRVLDCSYCLEWRRRRSELHASSTTSIYLMADFSTVQTRLVFAACAYLRCRPAGEQRSRGPPRHA